MLSADGTVIIQDLSPFIPIVPGPVWQSQSSIHKLLHEASDLNSIIGLVLLEKIILDQFQILACLHCWRCHLAGWNSPGALERKRPCRVAPLNTAAQTAGRSSKPHFRSRT